MRLALTKTSSAVLALLAVLLFAFGCWLGTKAFLAAYLAAWWFVLGILMGGLANVWLHNLTGGQWGEALRVPLLALSPLVWVAALLFLPVLFGMQLLYPWVADAGNPSRWADQLSAPEFKRVWLTPAFFIARSLFYLAIWVVLAALSRRPALQRSKPFAAVALIVYGFTVSLAGVDWIMSLMPLWYSSIFGMVVGTVQMLAGMAFAIVCVALLPQPPAGHLFRDFGNLLLMYVMTWAYLVFVEFLIIWAENLPHEIAWYLPRSQGGWLAVAWVQTLFLFFGPLLVLLSRQAKQAPRVLGGLAAFLLLMALLNAWWLVLPSVAAAGTEWLWAAPAAALALFGIVQFVWVHRRAGREVSHA
jgi:hypothetical protein